MTSLPVLLWLVFSMRILVALAIIGAALQLPRLVTVAIAVCGLLLCAPVQDLAPLSMLSTAQLALALGRELTIGATLGLVASLPLWAVSAAGAALDAQLVTIGPTSAITEHRRYYQLFWSLTAGMLFLASNGLALVLGQLTRSFIRLPIAITQTDAADAVADFARTTIASLGAVFSLAMPMAMPLLLTVMALMIAAHISGRIAGQQGPWSVVTGAMPLAVLVAVAAVYGATCHYITQIVVAALA